MVAAIEVALAAGIGASLAGALTALEQYFTDESQ